MKIIKSKNLSQKGQNLGAFNGVFHEKHSFGIRSKENLKRIKSLALLFLTFLLTTGFSFYNPQTKWKGDTPVLEFKVFLNTDLFTEEEAVARLNVIKEATGEWFGFPTSDVKKAGLFDIDRCSNFERGYIYWSPIHDIRNVVEGESCP